MLNKVRKTIKEHTLIREGDRIILGLSGGPDSVCLFYALMELADELEISIHPVHVNHKLRPEAAERDQHYVERICEEKGLKCRVFTEDCKAYAEDHDLTPEEAGRVIRYEAFYRVAEEVGGENVRIAVAQNANDQAETIIQRILRGTGTDGLAGIAYLRYEKDVPVIRPLLDVTRKEIEDYCDERGLEPVIDHTNSEPIYTRNRIRLELLPKLEEYNGNIVNTLNRLARIASADRDYLWQVAEDRLKEIRTGSESQGEVILDRERLAALPDPIRRRVVRMAFMEIGLDQDITEERLEAADEIIGRKQGPKTVEFPHGYRLRVAAGKVYFS